MKIARCLLWLSLPALAGMAAAAVAPAAATNTMSQSIQPTQLATLGGGCFWCVEALFEMLPGVQAVVSGYAGGQTPNPTYKEVCSGTTGHAEVVQIEFDPARISYAALLRHFWDAHDPTTLNRQGADVGTQYRSIILYHDAGQKAAAEQSRKEAQARFPRPIVTEIAPLTKFFPAEAHHQDYFRNNPGQGYCQMVIRPKVDKFAKQLKSATNAPAGNATPPSR